MKRLATLWCLILALALPAGAETSLRVSAGSSSLEFDFLYTEHYGLSRERTRTCASVLQEDDLLVALHLGRASGVDFEIIARWRRDGASWDEITRRCRRDCSIYYVAMPADARPGPPYGRAHGYWRKHPKGDLPLGDDEIHALVQLRALSDYSGLPPAEVARRRAKGAGPREFASKHHQSEDTAPAVREAKSSGNGKADGKGKGKGNGKSKN